MKQKSKSNHRHLTLSDRTYIEQELLQGSSFKKIGGMLGKDPTTISKEIRRNYKEKSGTWEIDRCRFCLRYKTCDLTRSDMIGICSYSRQVTHCSRKCKNCFHGNPAFFCPYFMRFHCNRFNAPPYVCNDCTKQKDCPLPRRIYEARHAQKLYEKKLVESRSGINLTPDELQQLDALISPLIQKRQPLSHIFAVHADEIPVCRRTLYNYLDQRVFQARNLDLPRRVRYKKRRRKAVPKTRGTQQSYRNKRTFKDFEYYLKVHPDTEVVEMDTVKGSRTSGKCLLTLLFRSCSFMVIILLRSCTQGEVVAAIDALTDALGMRLFRKYFPVILTDNGPEFKDPWAIEKTSDGKHRTFVYYCDPYVSNQKGRLEKSHEYIRYVIPKGRSMFRYTQEDISLLASHINSTARDSLNGQTPYDLAQLFLDKKIPASAGITRVEPDSILLKPELLDHPDRSKEAADE